MSKYTIYSIWVILAIGGCQSSSKAIREADGAPSTDAAISSNGGPQSDVAVPREASITLDASSYKDASSNIDAASKRDAATHKDSASSSDAASRSDSAGDASKGTDTGTQSTACDRKCLLDFVTKYLEALAARDPRNLKVADSLKFTENGDKLALGEGLWKTASLLRPYRQNFIDAREGQAGCFAIVEESGAPALFTLRLKIVNRKITEIETVVTRTGQASFFAPDSLTTPDPIFDQVLQTSERSSRDRMIELVKLYFDGLEAADASAVPFDPQCGRFENGVQTATPATIGMFAMFAYIDEIKRRYLIVDEERGLVWGIYLFMVASQSRTTFVAELFKITGEKLRAIEAFMVNQPYGKTWGW